MNFLNDVITYIRRIIKSPSNSDISDALIIDYINRFWINDVDPHIQVFDLKTTYSFQTVPGVDRYNIPLYDVQTETSNPNQTVAMYPVYQGFLSPAYINGIKVSFQTQKNVLYDVYPNVIQTPVVVGVGNGSAGPYTFQIPQLGPTSNSSNPPLQGLLRGHVDTLGIMATGNNVDPPLGVELDVSIPNTSVDSQVYFTSIGTSGQNVVIQDSGQFLSGNVNYGLLMEMAKGPYGLTSLPNGGLLPNTYATNQNTINYFTGTATNVYFIEAIPEGNNIYAQFQVYQNGLPRMILFYNNTLIFRVPPAYAYLVQIDAYLSPAAFFSTDQAIPFGYMSEYIARGAARKILSDTGDIEQMQFYEPLFREQEALVRVRAERQWTATRTNTIYNVGYSQGTGGIGYNGFGQAQ